MTNDELEDRVNTLENLVMRLIQHLVLANSLPPDIRGQMVDSLIDNATGNRGQEYHAERLAEAIEPSRSSEIQDINRRLLARQNTIRDLYGPKED